MRLFKRSLVVLVPVDLKKPCEEKEGCLAREAAGPTSRRRPSSALLRLAPDLAPAHAQEAIQEANNGVPIIGGIVGVRDHRARGNLLLR